MLKRATARSKAKSSTLSLPSNNSHNNTTSSSLLFHNSNTSSSVAAEALSSTTTTTPDDEIIERTRLKIPNAHVFKLPPKPTSGGWRGGDWHDKIWQGTLKVVERGENTAVLLVDANEERNIFAVCPIRHNTTTNIDDPSSTNSGGGALGNNNNGVDRCIDSSRYFVLRIQNAQGRHMYIGLAFNERNDAFDFNTALEDSRREKEVERKLMLARGGGGDDSMMMMYQKVDYTMKEGEKIHVSIPKLGIGGGGMGSEDDSPTNNEGGGGGDDGTSSSHLLTSSSAATRRRAAKKSPTTTTSSSSSSLSLLSWSSSSNKKGGGVLKPSSKDTPSRLT